MPDSSKKHTAPSEIVRLNEILEKNKKSPGLDKISQPPVFILGAPRSGTTLFEQVLVSSFTLGYIDNITARFWNSPYTGMALSNEIAPFSERILNDFNSDIGFTKGPLGPHEFGYFWQKWLKTGETHEAINTQDEKMITGLKQEVYEMINGISLPLILKNTVMVTINASLLSRIFPFALFIYIERDPVFTAQSLIINRQKLFGNITEWFSAKPEEYMELSEKTPAEQVVGQVYYCIQRIREARSGISEKRRFLRVDYVDLCERPVEVMNIVFDFFNANGYTLERKPYDLKQFESTDRQKIDNKVFSDIKKYSNKYFKE